MPQTTSGVPMSCARIDVATDAACAVWTNISGSSNSIAGTEQSKMVGEEFTLDGIGALVEGGKLEPFDMVVRIVYTNIVTEAYRIIRDVFKEDPCAGKVCLRYIPSGVVGGDGFQTNYALVSTFQWPEVNAGAAGPIMTQFTVRVSTIDPFVFAS